MTRYGRGSQHGHAMDSTLRTPAGGVGKMVFEFVKVSPSSDTVYVYNRNKTAYGQDPTDATTGAAIVNDIKYVEHITVTPYMVTGAPSTTTAQRPPVVKYINGPTTLALIYTMGLAAAGGSGVTIGIFGKSW